MRLPVVQQPFVERLNSLQQGLSFFPCFIGLFACLFDLTFELVESLTLFLNLVGDRIGTRNCRLRKDSTAPRSRLRP